MVEKKWHAVYTRPGKEKRVADLLTKKKIRNYLPLNKIESPENRGKRILSEPLFSRYVFVYLDEAEQASFYQSPDIINFVYWLDKPVVIKDNEINAINYFLNEYSFTRLEKMPVRLNGDYEIINEPLMIRKGNVLEVKTAKVKLMLPSLGHVLITELRKEAVEEFTYGHNPIVKNKVA